jgi:SAM-dependent methyltransferase
MTSIQAKHLYEAVWRQPEDVDRYIREKTTGRSINICSGESPLGDVQVDIDRDRDPDIQADFRNLPFPDASFDTVISDPPWKLEYYDRQKPFFELVRICKPDGKIYLNALWTAESENTTIDEVLIRADTPWSNISAVTVHHKQPGQTTMGEI